VNHKSQGTGTEGGRGGAEFAVANDFSSSTEGDWKANAREQTTQNGSISPFTMDRIVDHGTVRMVRCPHEVLERDAVPEDGPVEGHVTVWQRAVQQQRRRSPRLGLGQGVIATADSILCVCCRSYRDQHDTARTIKTFWLVTRGYTALLYMLPNYEITGARDTLQPVQFAHPRAQLHLTVLWARGRRGGCPCEREVRISDGECIRKKRIACVLGCLWLLLLSVHLGRLPWTSGFSLRVSGGSTTREIEDTTHISNPHELKR
jgi:hypothetical protein